MAWGTDLFPDSSGMIDLEACYMWGNLFRVRSRSDFSLHKTYCGHATRSRRSWICGVEGPQRYSLLREHQSLRVHCARGMLVRQAWCSWTVQCAWAYVSFPPTCTPRQGLLYRKEVSDTAGNTLAACSVCPRLESRPRNQLCYGSTAMVRWNRRRLYPHCLLTF